MARTLKVRQQVFVREYTKPGSPTFGNGTQAYLKAYPPLKTDEVAAVSASKLLRNVKVRTVIEGVLRKQGYDKARLESELAWNLEECRKVRKMGDHREAVKVLAQLRGDWKEKQEVTHLEDAQKDAIRQVVASALKN